MVNIRVTLEEQDKKSSLYAGRVYCENIGYKAYIEEEWLIEEHNDYTIYSMIEADTQGDIFSEGLSDEKSHDDNEECILLRGKSNREKNHALMKAEEKLIKLRNKLRLVGSELDFILMEDTNGKVILARFEVQGLYEVDLTKYSVDKVFTGGFGEQSSIKKLITNIRYHTGKGYGLPGIEELKELYIDGNEIVLNRSNTTYSLLERVITRPGEILKIGRGALEFSALLKEIDLSNVVEIGKYALRGSSIELKGSYDKLRVLKDDALKWCEHIGDIELHSIESIGDFAFGESSLRSIVIGTECIRYGICIFYRCKDLESVRIESNKPSELLGRTFYGCEKLKELVIPEGIMSIGDNEFCGSGIEKLILPRSCKKATKLAFRGMSETSVIYIPKGFDRDVFMESKFEGKIVEY